MGMSDLVFHICGRSGCGVLYGLSQGFQDRRREDKETFYCPNGHSHSYNKNEADRLKEELQSVRSELITERAKVAVCEAKRQKKKVPR